MGSHEVDALGDLLKGRLDVIAKEELHGSRHGQCWGLTRHFNFGHDNGDVDRIKNMVHSGEGCRVPGYVWVNRVPGNIHLWTYSHAYQFSSLCQETQGINVSHRVEHVSFGMGTVITFVKEHFAGTGIVSPLDGYTRWSNRARPQRQRPARGDFTAALGGALARSLEVSLSTTRKLVLTTYVLLYKTRSMCTSSRPTPKLPAGRRRPSEVRLLADFRSLHGGGRKVVALPCAAVRSYWCIFTITANMLSFLSVCDAGIDIDHPLIQRDALRCRW